MSEETDAGQSGGVSISGRIGVLRGDIVGRDKIIGDNSATELNEIFKSLRAAIALAPEREAQQADTLFAELKKEVAKGGNASDGVIAKLVDGLVGLVPGAASAVVSAFATPFLGSLAGPVTSFVLGKLRGG